jgi:microcystin-dependent protein
MGSPFIGEIKIVAFDYAPRGWALCNGQILAIGSNQALFSLLGTTYGGNGIQNFALPNLQTRVPLHAGPTVGLGQQGGEYAHTLSTAEIPQHNHPVRVDTSVPAASNSFTPAAGLSIGQSIGSSSQGGNFDVNIYSTAGTPLVSQATGEIAIGGGNQPHENRQPFLTLNFIIALNGIFPSRN